MALFWGFVGSVALCVNVFYWWWWGQFKHETIYHNYLVRFSIFKYCHIVFSYLVSTCLIDVMDFFGFFICMMCFIVLIIICDMKLFSYVRITADLLLLGLGYFYGYTSLVMIALAMAEFRIFFLHWHVWFFTEILILCFISCLV